RHTRFSRDWSSDVCSSDLTAVGVEFVENQILQASAVVHNQTVRFLIASEDQLQHHEVGQQDVRRVGCDGLADGVVLLAGVTVDRSEERRVGKGRVARWTRY